MNLILLDPEDFVSRDRVRLTGRRLDHVRHVCRASVGESLRVGEVGGMLGFGCVLSLAEQALELEVRLDQAPPAPLAVTLAVALPRPPALRRLLQQATALGVKRILLFHSRRVEKSYWQSHGLESAAIEMQLRLGLEQARDTILPEVGTRRRFRPFAEDEVPELAKVGAVLVADPGAAQLTAPTDPGQPSTLIVGPEGGLVPFELELLVTSGARLLGLGERVLRVETAVVALLARLAL